MGTILFRSKFHFNFNFDRFVMIQSVFAIRKKNKSFWSIENFAKMLLFTGGSIDFDYKLQFIMFMSCVKDFDVFHFSTVHVTVNDAAEKAHKISRITETFAYK